MSTNLSRKGAAPVSGVPSMETSSASADPALQRQTDPSSFFQPCCATAALFLFAHQNIIYCLHHDSLAVERTLVKHRADIAILAADNVSERNAGRLAVSYDVGTNAIVWDLFTGTEVARFASYEFVRVANWLIGGRLAFGDVQGSITLFEPSTSEHLTITTIFEPINAIGQSPNCGMFAIGYENGSVLICQLEPGFTIMHSLSTADGPASIASLAWHGTLTKQKTEMLAVQNVDGELRVWGIPKGSDDIARTIRVINAPVDNKVQKAWSAWSKSGRLVQYCDGDTRAWDVRARNITFERVPTVPSVTGIAVYGPSATLFTITTDYKIQQYDLIGQDSPILIAEVSHIRTIQRSTSRDENAGIAGIRSHFRTRSRTGGSESEAVPSPFERILKGKEVDKYDDEERDKLGPLSPASSKASVSSTSSYGHRSRPTQHRRTTPGSDITVFSSGTSALGKSSFSRRERTSRSGSAAPPRTRSTALRQEILRSPGDIRHVQGADLFPQIRARFAQVQLRLPQSGLDMSVTDLQKEMLNVIFGWPGSIIELLRFEQERHQPGSAGSILLSKWSGEPDIDNITHMVGSGSMTSSDWMLLALSNQFGQGSQRAVGEAFVRRLLETGEVNPAVAILLGMDEKDVAVEVYSARQCFLEAVLLNCAVRPYHWESQTQLLRRWGEALVAGGQNEAAIRCFACASMTPSRGYVSSTDESGTESDLAPFSSPPRSLAASPPVAKSRLAAMNAPLKLITNFDKSRASSSRTPDPKTVISQEVGETWRHTARSSRERSESRTATPGNHSRQRLPSASTRATSGSRRQADERTITRAPSSQSIGRPSAGTGTPSTVRTARPGGGASVDFSNDRANTGRQTSYQSSAPDISITTPADQTAEHSSDKESGSPHFLEDMTRRVSNVIKMQRAQSPDAVNSDSKVRRHAKRASEDIQQQRAVAASTSHTRRPGSVDIPRKSLDSTSTTKRSQLSSKQLAALELEERRQSLLRRPSIPVIPHPSELVPRSNLKAESIAGSFRAEVSSSASFNRGMSIERSATADLATISRHAQAFGGHFRPMDVTPVSAISRNVSSSEIAFPASSSSTTAPDPGPTLPSTVYQRPAIVRSVTAPPEDPAVTAMRRRNSLKPARQLPNIDESATTGANTPLNRAFSPRPSLDADGDVFPELSLPDILAQQRQNSSPAPPPPPPIVTSASPPSPTAIVTTMDVPLGLDNPVSATSARVRRPGLLGTNPTSTGSPVAGTRRPSLDRITAAVTRRIRSASRSGGGAQGAGASPVTRVVSPPYETVLDALPSTVRERDEGGQGPRRDGDEGRLESVVYRHPKEVRDRVAREREREGGPDV